jgi:thiamine phosphate synthase YjbQ (UPF0047 family)
MATSANAGLGRKTPFMDGHEIMGRKRVVTVTWGRLDFGPWEQIFYAEVDSHRCKRALVKIIGL